MVVRTVAEALAGVQRLAVDSAPWIYFVEEHPAYVRRVREVVRRAEEGDVVLVTSTLTLTEVLTLPFRRQEIQIAEAYKSILLNSPHLVILPVDAEVAERAARLRAGYTHLRTPDSIQLAVAIEGRCGAFLTNDKRLPSIEEMPFIQLENLEA